MHGILKKFCTWFWKHMSVVVWGLDKVYSFCIQNNICVWWYDCVLKYQQTSTFRLPLILVVFFITSSYLTSYIYIWLQFTKAKEHLKIFYNCSSTKFGKVISIMLLWIYISNIGVISFMSLHSRKLRELIRDDGKLGMVYGA